MKKNAFLTFIFACIPGAGQMYYGYMKRGLSMITFFCLFIMAGTLVDVLVVGSVIVWMYSFFDTYDLIRHLAAGEPKDDDLLLPANWDNIRAILPQHNKLLGWGLIVLGALVAYQNILMNTLGDIVWRWGKSSPFFRALYLMMDQLPEIVVCVALIICGAWLVRGPKGRKPKQKAADADFTEYAAQETPAGPEKKGFAMPKLSALLGKPVTPEDETEDEDGREE